jgi:hypothetical protein
MNQMLKKQTYIFQGLSLFVLLIGLFGCEIQEKPKDTSCDLEENPCLTLKNQNLTVQFNTQNLFVENSYVMTIDSNQKITHVKLRGINMNMGEISIPLTLITQKPGAFTYQGRLFLGMCSEPKMKWELELANGNAILGSYGLFSYWSKDYVED